MIKKTEKSVSMPTDRVWRGMFRGMSPALRSTRYVYLAENLQMSKVGTFKPRKGYNRISLNQFIGGIYKDMAICKGYDEVGTAHNVVLAGNTDYILVGSGLSNITLNEIANSTTGDVTSGNVRYSVLPFGIVNYMIAKPPYAIAIRNIFQKADDITQVSEDKTAIYPVELASAASAGYPLTGAIQIKCILEYYSGGYSLKKYLSEYMVYYPSIHLSVQGKSSSGSGRMPVVSVDTGISSVNIKAYHFLIQYYSSKASVNIFPNDATGDILMGTWHYLCSSDKPSRYLSESEVDARDTDWTVTATEDEFYANIGQSISTISEAPNANHAIDFFNRAWYGGCIIQREQPEQSSMNFYENTRYGELGDLSLGGTGGTNRTAMNGDVIGCCFVYADGKESKLVTATISTLYEPGAAGEICSALMFPIPSSGDVVGKRVYRGVSPGTTIRQIGDIDKNLIAFYGGDHIIDQIDVDLGGSRLANNSDGLYETMYNFPNTLMWSDVGIPHSVGIESREDFGSPSESIVGIYGFENNLYVFKETEVWLARISGNTYPIQWKKKISDSYGCLDKNSIIEAMGNIFFLSENTFVRINVNTVEQFGKEQLGALLTDLLDSNFVGCHAIFNDEDNELWFTVSNSGATNYGRTFIFNLDVQSWTVYNYARSAMDKLPDTPIIGLQYAATGSIFAESVLLNKDIDTSPTGSVLATSIDWKIDTGFLGQDNPMAEKVVRYITLDASDLTVTNQYDTEGDEGDNTGTGITKTATGPTRLDYIYPMDSGKKNRYPKIRLSGSTDTASTTEGEISTVVYRYQERMQDGKS